MPSARRGVISSKLMQVGLRLRRSTRIMHTAPATSATSTVAGRKRYSLIMEWNSSPITLAGSEVRNSSQMPRMPAKRT